MGYEGYVCRACDTPLRRSEDDGSYYCPHCPADPYTKVRNQDDEEKTDDDQEC